MEHLTLKAVTTATDEGIFEAVISTASIDRDGDIVEPTALVTALQKWANLGKRVPLAWSHARTTGPNGDVYYVTVGHIDPASARVVGDEVVAKGWIDQDAQHGKEAWRLVKSGTLSFSYGYLVPEGGASKRRGATRGSHIKEIDLYEVSIVPVAPANNDTRVLSFKSVDDEALTDEELQERRKDVEEALEAEFIENAEKALPELVDEPEPEPEPEPVIPDADEQRKRAEKHERDLEAEQVPEAPEVEPEYATLRITHEEMAGLAEGQLKAVWSAAFIDTLPDSAFLYVESGGKRDSDGKTTPRSLRHFPYKDGGGKVDLPHLRNALARIPQSNLPQSVKDSLTAKAQRILDGQKSADVTDKEQKDARSVDTLRERADALALEFMSGGESLRKPPQIKVMPKPEPELSERELRERARDEMLKALSGVTDNESF